MSSESDEQWIEVNYGQTAVMDSVTYILLSTDSNSAWCDKNNFACQDYNEGSKIEAYNKNELVKSCGTLAVNKDGRSQAFQSYTFDCGNVEADKVRISSTWDSVSSASRGPLVAASFSNVQIGKRNEILFLTILISSDKTTT